MNTPKLPPLPEREAFEAWMQGDATISLDKDGHGYVDMTAELMWHAWKARATITAQGVPDGWADAYSAFHGAFDTPLARRRDDSVFANDARRRMREFNEKMRASAPPAPQADSTKEQS